MEFMSSLQHGTDDHKPSLFGMPVNNSVSRKSPLTNLVEILSEQQLAALIPPSLRYLLTVATHRNPRYLLRVLNSFDEIYALLMLAVERHYLRTYSGGFTENFYGLKRERVLGIPGGEAPRAQLGAPELMRETLKLSRSDIWKNVAVMIGLPYLKRKLDEGFEIHGATQAAVVQMGPNYRRNELPADATVRQKIFWYYKWFLRKIYPSINAAYYFSILAFNLAYLFDNTKYSSPFLWLIGTRLRRLNHADYRAIALAAESPSAPTSGSRPGETSSILSPTIFTRVVIPQLLSSLQILLPTSIFALKFLEWWHASDFASQLSKKAVEGLDLPPPVISGLPTTVHSQLKSSSNATKMPSSTQARSPTNTVALSSSASNTTSSPPPSSTPPTSQADSLPSQEVPAKSDPQISSLTHLPIFTVSPPTPSTSPLCPICRHPIQTPTSAQTGYVFCYTCIFRWVDGTHERQAAFMEGRQGGEWDDDEVEAEGEQEQKIMQNEELDGRNKEGKWENGKGRCAVTGRRVLGGTDGLRRVMA